MSGGAASSRRMVHSGLERGGEGPERRYGCGRDGGCRQRGERGPAGFRRDAGNCFAAALERDHLLVAAISVRRAVPGGGRRAETGGDGFALKIFESEQVVVDLEGHAGVLAAVQQFLEGSGGMHDIEGHAGNDEETEGEVKQTGCGLAGH